MKNVFERAAGRAADSAATDFRAGSHFPARLIARALFWLLPLLFLLGAPCLASETGLVLSGYLTPGELVVPGEVTLSLTLQNTSDEAIFNVRIFMQTASGADEISRYDAIAAGEIVEATQVVRVTQAQLDAGEVVVFINSGLETETIAGSGNIGIPIEKARANVQLEFTRQLSSQYVEEGETITIAYMVRNLGNVDLRQISVHDALGNFEERIASLSPGESKTFLNHAMVGADAQSEAYVTYTPQTETAQRRQDLANVEIYLARESLEVELESNMQDVYYGGQVELTARVTNTGSVTLTAISLTDPAPGIFTDKPFCGLGMRKAPAANPRNSRAWPRCSPGGSSSSRRAPPRPRATPFPPPAIPSTWPWKARAARCSSAFPPSRKWSASVARAR